MHDTCRHDAAVLYKCKVLERRITYPTLHMPVPFTKCCVSSNKSTAWHRHFQCQHPVLHAASKVIQCSATVGTHHPLAMHNKRLLPSAETAAQKSKCTAQEQPADHCWQPWLKFVLEFVMGHSGCNTMNSSSPLMPRKTRLNMSRSSH
jgi:hypothetical protein